MALAAGEFKSGGRVVDKYGRDSLKTETAGSALAAGDYKSGGVVRDSDGRIVVVVEALNAALTAGSVKSGGRLFDDKGRLIVAVSNAALVSGEVLSGGEITDNKGRVVVTNETLDAAYSAGDYNTGGGARSALGRRLVAGAGTPFANYTAAVLADSPISYWHLGESAGTTATDVRGVNAGTYSGGFTLGATGAIAGDTAVTFNGSTGLMSAGTTNIPTGASARTIEAWVNRAATGATNSLCQLQTAAGQSFSLIATDNGSSFFTDSVNVGNNLTLTADRFGTAQWVHTVFTLDGSNNWVLYINGVSAQSGTFSVAINTAALTAVNWAQRVGAGQFLNGSLDELAIYAGALAPGRVAAHYAARL